MKMLNDLSLAQGGRRLCGEGLFFQQDNTAIHNASITKKYLLEQKIRFLDRPACSPDLSPKENLWGLIFAKVHKEGRKYTPISALKNAILDASSVQFAKRVDKMSSRIFEVIKANGESTKN